MTMTQAKGLGFIGGAVVGVEFLGEAAARWCVETAAPLDSTKME